tara:strand:- start:196 stop:318 length:123 start_codon:yes stop_codon:yes gene_type:complete
VLAAVAAAVVLVVETIMVLRQVVRLTHVGLVVLDYPTQMV